MGDTAAPGRFPGLARRLCAGRLRFVVLGVVGALVATTGWFLWRDRGPTPLPEVAGQATSPAQVGLGFLTAVSQGRSADAAAYLKDGPGTAVSTSDAVLAASALLHPITDIVVLDTEQRDDSGTVTVRYQFGSQRVIDTYKVARHGRYWRLVGVAEGGVHPEAPGYVQIDLAETAVREQLTINDVALPADQPLRLFPGTYRIGSSNPLLTSDEVLVVPALSTDLSTILQGSRYGGYLPHLTLTDAGRQQVTQAVQTTIDTCLQEVRLVTSCGLRYSVRYDLESGRTPVESSLRWTVAPTSIDITSTRPVVVGQAQADPAIYDQVPGLWAYWHDDAFGTVTAVGSVAFSDGVRRTDDDLLYYYAVEISDPDHLVVFSNWLSSGNEARRGSL